MLLKYYQNFLIKNVLFIFLLSTALLNAQIVNVENLRHEIDSIGWSSHARLDTEIEKNNTSRIVSFTNQLRVQYKGEESLWFLIHDMSIKEINSTEIVNNSTQHLRFSHKISSKISYEAFLQSQSDRISEIKLRALAGSGIRYSLFESQKYKFYLGTTLMYEYENSIDEIESVHNDVRNSNYFSLKIKPNENIYVVSSNYYQPLVNKFSDFRILSETSVTFKVFKKLRFITTFYYIFDSFPVTNVAKEQFKLTNGLIYFFE